MCTAISYRSGDHYFGRNLDLEYSYQESVTVTPRKFPFVFRKAAPLHEHYAMIGMAYVAGGYPLYYEATNERGLSVAGLNFPGNACYGEEQPGKDNIAPFELIPWLLGRCADVAEVRVLLERINLVNINFDDALPLSPLHWIISDKEESIVVEAMADGLHIHENPVHVLTNNPPFPFHLQNLTQYMGLVSTDAANTFAPGLELNAYCRGTGALGLPGDWSSPSRFVRAAFALGNAVSEGEMGNVSQFFHMLGAVEMPRGCVKVEEGVYDITVYSCCCNTDKGIYYYVTYDNRQITAVDMHRCDLEGGAVISYSLVKDQQIRREN